MKMRDTGDVQPVMVTGDEGGTIIIETFDAYFGENLDLIFQRASGGWTLTIRRSNAGAVVHKMPINYTQANVLGFMLRAARGDDTP